MLKTSTIEPVLVVPGPEPNSKFEIKNRKKLFLSKKNLDNFRSPDLNHRESRCLPPFVSDDCVGGVGERSVRSVGSRESLASHRRRIHPDGNYQSHF